MTEESQTHKPNCFGDLDTVFPKGKNDLRHSPETCVQCVHKTECLTTAMKNKSGLKFQEEMINRAYRLKKISLLERWSRKKVLHQKQKKIDKN
jgi:hypothetical protein